VFKTAGDGSRVVNWGGLGKGKPCWWALWVSAPSPPFSHVREFSGFSGLWDPSLTIFRAVRPNAEEFWGFSELVPGRI
jgi:hypothetical protein